MEKSVTGLLGLKRRCQKAIEGSSTLIAYSLRRNQLEGEGGNDRENVYQEKKYKRAQYGTVGQSRVG
jgi:hypothetical protein